MQKTKKNVQRLMSLVLALVMAVGLNFGGLTAEAAAGKPTAQTQVDKPEGVSAARIAGKTANFYQDDNGDEVYLRYVFPNDTDTESLKSVKVELRSTKPVTSEEVTVTASGNKYTFTADLYNKAPKIAIDGKEYIVAAGMEAGQSSFPEGFVTAAKVNGVVAAISRTIQDNPCPGNIYYQEMGIDWIVTNNQILAREVGKVTNPERTKIAYTINGVEKTAEVDLTLGHQVVRFGNYEYMLLVTFVEGFVATADNFWIDFQEMRDSENPKADADALAKAEEIQQAVAAYYADTTVSKAFPAGTTNMDVIQTILQYAIDKGLFSYPDETTVGPRVTYIAEINGLGEFDVGSMSGWMYTNDPDPTIAPENWYTAPIGAADYVLSTDSTIAWFFVVNYATHPWS